ncbi:MAG TPA: ATP-binding protein [Terriglobia bacterium]|nr:ATP-binding protein [Terriglobia bacterium]
MLRSIRGLDDGGSGIETARWWSPAGDPLRLAGTRMAHAKSKTRRQQPGELRTSAALGPAGVAHDVDNLLTAILGDCGFLLRQVRRDDRLRAMVEGVMNAAEFAALLTRQLVASSGVGIRSPQALDLGDILAKMTGTLRAVLGSKIILKVRAQPGSGSIEADPGDLIRLILNLAFNARDAMPDGGTLVFRTESAGSDGKRPVHRRDSNSDCYVLLIASDTGCGMDEETRAHLFEPSFTTKSKAGPGSRGMGLATIQEVVRTAGGFIEVDSQPGRGTTFRIYFRRLRSPLDPPPARHAVVPRSRRTATILVVEDNESVRVSVCRTLKMCGHTVVAASSAPEALEIAAHADNPIHLLLTDAELPGASGLVLARRLRASHPQTKVLLTSGYRVRGSSRKGLVAGFLPKPFSPSMLAKKVSEILEETES